MLRSDCAVVTYDLLTQNGKFSDLLFSLSNALPLLSFYGKYKQNIDIRWSFPFSPVADIFIKVLENLALQSYDFNPKDKFRYVDYTFIICDMVISN